MKNFYLTTTLPYVNDIPHIGHALEFIQADVIVRFFRSKLGSENVWFNVGTDEHGLKIYQKAGEAGKTPKEYTDYFAGRWQDFCKLFEISYDTFYRTSTEEHKKAAQIFWQKSLEKEDIYKKSYTGLYCVGCEEFKTEKDLVDGLCPLHGKAPIEISEENYFFRLSKYKEQLLDLFTNTKDILSPEKSLEELKQWISNMEDISISRVKEKLPWGVSVPGDDTQVMYVWFDALTNYVNVLGYGTENSKSIYKKNSETFENWWPGVQIFGPDNLRFQCAIWQAMLLSADLPNTKKFLRHGMILASDGTKMSKTKGNVVSPFDQALKFSPEIIRFYMISGLSTFGDSAYKEEDLINLYNARLANNFGNLINRVIHLLNKFENKVLDPKADFKKVVDAQVQKFESLMLKYELEEAYKEVNDLANFGNEYITEKAPWDKNKTKDEVLEILGNLNYLLTKVIELYAFVIPEKASVAKQMLKKLEPGVLFEKLETIDKK